MIPASSDPAWPARHRWPVTLESGPLRLRPLKRSDERAWDEVRGRNWDWLRPWEPTAPSGSAADVLSFRALSGMLRQQARDQRACPWVVEIAEGRRRRLIGQVSVTGIVMGSARFGQIGYWIDRDYAGLGITPYCVAWASDYCFDVMGLHRLEVCIRPENRPSLRVVEKLGLREEGLRPSYLHIDGEWRDHRVFAVTAAEARPGLRSRVAVPRLDAN